MAETSHIEFAPVGLTSGEVAEVLRTTRDKVQELCRARAIRHVRTWQGHYLIPAEALEEYVAAHTVEAVG